MRHDATGWWLEEARAAGLAPPPAPPLTRDARADVVVVGGGYTGLWTAWWLRALGGADVVLLEAGRCGHGPSGRNGGFCEDLWLSLPALTARFGDERALALCRASEAAVAGVEAFCAEQEVDAWFRRAGQLVVSTAPAHDGRKAAAVAAAARLGVPGKVVALDGAAARARFGAPAVREATFLPTGASVQPGRLALGLAARVRDAGVRVHEATAARRLVGRAGGDGSVEVVTATGARVRAGHAVVAAGAALAGFAPLRGRLAAGSSHVVLTEPVPDVLEALGWTGGETVTDGRTLLHYLRTTRDGRIAFGWAGGRAAFGARLGGRVEVDPAVARAARAHLVRLLPALRGRAITHAWGGPIDIAPAHLPAITALAGGRAHAAAGYTGNGVGPSAMVGRALAALALGRAGDPWAALPLVGLPPGRPVPPEPLRWVGAGTVRAALVRAEAAQERGERPRALARLVAGLPGRLGITVAR
jgi:glycine/D-amino acid oxidase-like deaminating enzyme